MAASVRAEDSPERISRVKALAATLTSMAQYGPDRLGYLEFAASQLRDRYKQEFPGLEQSFGRRAERSGRRGDFDAFSLLSGGLAIRESLQLDRIRTVDPADETVPLSSLKGPETAMHPFKEMLAGRAVNVPAMAQFIPQDFYFLHVEDPARALDLLGRLADAAGPAVNRFLPAAVDFRTQEKIIQQLGLRIDPSNQKYYGFIFEDIAVTGSDPFFGSGADITVIFRLKRKDTFLNQIADYRGYFRRELGASLSKEDFGGVSAELLSTRDRRVYSYLVSLPGDIVILSNSRAALKRVLSVWRKEQPSLGDQDEYKFMRTIYPYDPEKEAAFLYLSDPFIRRLTGPEVRIKEARRVMESARLAALERYAILYYHLNGRRAASLAELASEFGSEAMESFKGQTVTSESFAARGPLGQIGLLVPNLDFDLTNVSQDEADGYESFLHEYNSYWRTYFDPVGMRLSGERTVRIETCILPLIENSFYKSLQEFSGTEPIALGSADSALKGEVLSASARISREKLGELLNKSSDGYLESRKIDLSEIFGEEAQIHVLDALPLVDFDAGILLREVLRGSSDQGGKALGGFLIWSLFHPLRVSIPLKSPQAEPKALALVDELTSIAATKSGRGEFRVDRYEQIQDGLHSRVLLLSIAEVVKIRLYFAVHGGTLHITTTSDHMQQVLAGGLEKSLPDRFFALFQKPAPVPQGHLLGVLRPGRLQLERALALANAGETARDAAFENLSTHMLLRDLFGDSPSEASYRSFGFFLDPASGFQMQNGKPVTAFGSPGSAVIDQDRGAAWQNHLNTKEMRLSLEFTKEGLKSVVEIEP